MAKRNMRDIKRRQKEALEKLNKPKTELIPVEIPPPNPEDIPEQRKMLNLPDRMMAAKRKMDLKKLKRKELKARIERMIETLESEDDESKREKLRNKIDRMNTRMGEL